MNHSHPDDVFVGPNGSTTTRATRTVTGDETMTGEYDGSVCIHAGTFTLGRQSTHNGSLAVRADAKAEILGTHNGSLHVEPGAVVVVSGKQNGSVHVAADALLEVRASGQVAGSLAVAGRINNAGVRGGSVSDLGGVIYEVDGGRVKQPDRSTNDTRIYRW